MKVARMFVGIALAVAFAATLPAQQAGGGNHTVACFKVNPDKAADYRKWEADEVHKVTQGRIDSGEINTWYLLRSVLPQGTASACDYIVVTMFPGTAHLLGPDEITAALQKAGMKITAQDYINHRNAVTTLVSVAIFQNVASVGSPKKGDYFRVNYMKVPNIEDWVAYEKKVWLPLADASTKAGLTSGWSLNVQVLPGGADLPFQAVTVDTFSTYDAVFNNDSKLFDLFRKVHPDLEVGTTFEQFGKLRTMSSIQLYQLEDMVTK
jgi:hypothetical protein